ncbi:MAG: polysaccharide biosynthesis tyrosine autokinase, partial [Cyanobacteria bacterium P01_F01_bin.42]
MIELKYRDSDPQVSAAVINQLMDVYQQHNLKVNRSQSVAARQFISQQIPRSDGKRREAQRQLKEFKQRYQIVEPTEEATVAIEELGELQGQIIATRADLEDVQEREIQLRKQLGGTSSSKAIASTSISGSQRLQEGIRALEEAQDELAAAEEVLTPNHPDLLNLQEKVASLSGNLQTRLSRSTTVVSGAEVNEAGQTVGSELINELVRAETSADGLRQRLADLEKSYQVQVASTLQYPELEEQFRQLSLDVEVATLAYTSLYESLQKALIAENQNIGNVSILHQASVPKEPISPRVLLNLLMGGVLGILLGTGLSLLVDARDLRLRTLEDVRRVYDYALLGAVPDFSETIGADANARANSLFVRDQPRSMISETYRMVNTNLQFSSSDNLQVVVISSGMPGEGKSSTLANIALAMAELGNRVILIDADMRLPSQHQVWELPNRKGLSHVLVDQNESFDRLPVIAENEGLDILPAGALPPNPTSLLSSQRFSALIKHLRERYDHVLIDAPPITVASDALLISQVVDGLLLVARPGKLNRAAANVAANMIRQAQVNILGVIGNAIRSKDETNGTQYYQQEYYGKESLAEETVLASSS